MQRLQIKLLLCLLGNRLEIGTKSGFGDGLGIIVIVLLAFVERLNVNRWDDQEERVPSYSAA